MKNKKDIIVKLTGREGHVLQLMRKGRTSFQIAMELKSNPGTIENHRRTMMKKLQVHTVSELVKEATRLKLISST